MHLSATKIHEIVERNKYPHLQEQLGYTNADELVEHAINLVAHPEKTRELSILNAAMFDHFLAPHPTAQYILHILYEL